MSISPSTNPTEDAAAASSAGSTAKVARIGRYTHAELQAMVGRRGRKPPEFFELFPPAGPAARVRPGKPAKPAKPAKPGKTRVKALPAVSSVIIGDHTIDELLAMIGLTGRKPVAYDILQQVAQVFVDAGAVELPPAPVDPLLSRFAAAPKPVREAITALLAATSR
jgi:hypothetical protein